LADTDCFKVVASIAKLLENIVHRRVPLTDMTFVHETGKNTLPDVDGLAWRIDAGEHHYVIWTLVKETSDHYEMYRQTLYEGAINWQDLSVVLRSSLEIVRTMGQWHMQTFSSLNTP
jgi:hypothetical protein